MYIKAMKLQYNKTKSFITCVMLIGLMSICLSFNVNAATILHSTENGGEIDRIYHRKNKLDYIIEADFNSDTEMEQYVFKPKGRLVRRERDFDFDNIIDTKLYYVDEQLIREEHFTHDGQLFVVIDYDDLGQPSKKMSDTNGDGRFNLVFNLIDGEVSGSIRDTDSDGHPNVWEIYENNMMVEQRVDTDGDHILDFITRFDPEELPFSMSLDNDKDGFMETYRTYDKGELSEEMMDHDQDGRYETIVYFMDNIPIYQKIDRNSDGKFDTVTRFKKELPYFQKMDSNLNGVLDRFTFYEKGLLKEAWEDSNHTGRFDQFRYFNKDTGMYLLARDKNYDGTIDIRAFYNKEGKREKVESDTILDERFDTWEIYGDEGLVRMEKDEDRNGKVDLVGYYSGGELEKSIKDQDSDGRFEITQWFNKPGWTMVMALDADFDGNSELRNFIKGTTIKIKEMDNNSDGNIDRREFSNKDGKITKIEIDEDSVGKMNVVWHYDSDEKPTPRLFILENRMIRSTKIASATTEQNKIGITRTPPLARKSNIHILLISLLLIIQILI